MMQCSRVVIINDFSINNGGASAIAIENAIQLAKLGVEVTFISADGEKNPLQDTENIDCISLEGTALNPDKPVQGMITGLHNVAATAFIKRWVAKYDSKRTVYHIHCWSKIFSPSLFSALSSVTDRMIVHAHDYFPVCPNGSFVDYQTNTDCELTPGSIACLKSQCDQRSYVHKLWRFGRHKLREHWINFDQTKAKLVLLHEVMRPFFLRADVAPANLSLLANPIRPYSSARIAAEQNDTFVFIGRVVPEKGVDTFLEAVTKANVKAKVIGAGESLEQLMVQYPNIEFTGWQDQATIIDHLSTARTVVMPSKLRETFGLVAVEALSSGLPVILSQQSPLVGDVESLNVGQSFITSNAEDLAGKMQQFAQDDALIKQMSENGHEHWREIAHEPEVWGRRLLALYNAQLNG